MFKDYNMNQLVLPLDLEIKLQQNDIAFHVHHLVESIPSAAFESFIQHEGCPAYHPRMLFYVYIHIGFLRSENRSPIERQHSYDVASARVQTELSYYPPFSCPSTSQRTDSCLFRSIPLSACRTKNYRQ